MLELCFFVLYAATAAAKSLQSCRTLCNLMDCSLPGSSVLGILQARILEWVAMPPSRCLRWICALPHLHQPRNSDKWCCLLEPPFPQMSNHGSNSLATQGSETSLSSFVWSVDTSHVAYSWLTGDLINCREARHLSVQQNREIEKAKTYASDRASLVAQW